MRVGIYIRVSTDEQAREGFSIEAQRRILNAWAIVKGAEQVIEYVDDGYSAKNLSRPAVQQLIDACSRRLIDTIIVWKLDRLTRNLRDLLMLFEDVFHANGISFVSSTESIDTSTPSGRLMLNILGAFAQNERENTALRTSTVMLELSKHGRHLGGRPPYGYTVTPDMHYAIDPREAEAVRMIFEMKLAGNSYDDIIHALTAAGHLSRSGAPFSRNTIYDMLRNEKYTGTYIYNRAQPADKDGRRNNRSSKSDDLITRIPNGMPTIISYEKWKAVQSMSLEGKALGGKNSAKHIYLLSGLVRCGRCGKTMNIANGGKCRDGSYWRVYRCKDKCVHGVEFRKLENCVLDFLVSLVSEGDLVQRTLDLVDQLNSFSATDRQQDTQAMHSALAEMQRERDNLLKLASKSDDPPVSLLSEIKRRDAEISQQKIKISNAELSALHIDKEAVLARFDRLINVRSLDRAEQKMVVRDIVESVTIYDDRIDISITTIGHGGPEPYHAAIVKYITLTVSSIFLQRHKFPVRFFPSCHGIKAK